MKRYLVTGGAGFIGSHLVDLILEHGDKVVVLDKLSWGGDRKNLPVETRIVGDMAPLRAMGGLPKNRCVLVVGDVANLELVDSLVKQCDGTFHLAAQTHVDRSYGDVRAFVESNIVGSDSILHAHRDRKDLRLVYVSTDEVYGDKTEGFSAESDPLQPRNPYSTMKACGDLMARNYASVFGANVVIARPANNYGPRQFPEKLIPRAIDCFMRRKRGDKVAPFPVFGSGDQVRDWLFVKDHVQALWLLMKSGKPGKAYNLGAHQFRTVKEVLAAIAELCEVKVEDHVKFAPDRIMGDQRYALSFATAREELGWSPATQFPDGLLRTFNWQARQMDEGGATWA